MYSVQTTDNTRRGSFAPLASCVLALLLLASVVGRAAADAVPLTLEELTAISSEIVAVRVDDVKCFAREGKIYSTATFDVLENYKGKMTGTQSITYLGGKWNSLVMNVPAIPALHQGEESVLFLNKPVDAYPKAMRDKALANGSPTAASFQIVGGYQGRFVLFNAGQPAKVSDRKGTAAVPLSLKVSRATTDATSAQVEKAPVYGDFQSAIRDLVSEQRKAAARKGAEKSIAGIQGKYAIAGRSTSPVVRSFDPLPGMAYLSDAELAVLKQKRDEMIDARDAAKKADAASAPQQDGSAANNQ